MAAINEGVNQRAADIARSAGDEDRLRTFCFRLFYFAADELASAKNVS